MVLTLFKVTDFATDHKRIYDFIVVINSNLHPTLHHFQDIAHYLSNFALLSLSHSFEVNHKLGITKFGSSN